MLPVSNDTLLRVVRRRGARGFILPTVIGIDDWAWRRNQRVIVTGGRNAFQAGLVKYIPRETLLKMVRNIQSPAT